VFFDEWSDFLDQVAVTPDELIITGDLFFYLDDTKNGDARKSCLDNLQDRRRDPLDFENLENFPHPE
jgi:hypothetical protein